MQTSAHNQRTPLGAKKINLWQCLDLPPKAENLPLGGMRKFTIRVCHGRETAMQACIAPNMDAAWDAAWALCEKLLGPATIPRLISVRVLP